MDPLNYGNGAAPAPSTGGIGGFLGFVDGLAGAAGKVGAAVQSFKTPKAQPDASNGGGQDSQAQAASQKAASEQAKTTNTLLYVALGIGAVLLAVFGFAALKKS